MLLEVLSTFINIKESYVALDYRSHYGVGGFTHHEKERFLDDILCLSLISLLH